MNLFRGLLIWLGVIVDKVEETIIEVEEVVVEPPKPKTRKKKVDLSPVDFMTRAELNEFAAANGVDVKKSWKKAQVVKAIKENLQ